MPMIYKRFTEKTAEEWRQIYKALQLLEFLIKHGSERVIDDARSHLSLLRMLRQFHYIDQNGKDQGLNVRNRAKELAELLSNVDTIRTERKKARTTRNKYGGYEGGMGMSGGMSQPGYGGFGAESAGGGYGGYSGGVYGDGGGFGGRSGADEYDDSSQSRRDRFEEYDEHDNGGATSSSARREGSAARTAPAKQPAKPKEPEVDLFDFGDDDIASTPAISAAPTSNGKQPSAAADDFGVLQGGTSAGANDDFDDFQSAAPSRTTQSTGTTNNANLFAAISPPPSNAATSQISTPSIQAAMQPQRQPSQTTIPQIPQPGQQQPKSASGPNYAAFNMAPPPSVTSPPLTSPQSQQSTPANRPQPSGFQAAQPNYFGSVPLSSTASGTSTPATGSSKPMSQQPTGMAAAQQSKPAGASGGDPFASLGGGAQGKKNQTQQKGPTMADMAKQKASAGIWGANAPAQQQGGGGDLI